MAEGDHKKYSPSSSKRWLNCPGGCNFIKQLPVEPTKEATAKGTATHELASDCLLQKKRPEEFTGRIIEVEIEGIGGKFCFPVDADMIRAVNGYIDYCYSVSQGATEIRVEHKIDLGYISSDLGGTLDFAAVFFGDHAVVGDYKNGRFEVSADHNPQLMIYALGIIGEWNDSMVEYVDFFIDQPNKSFGNPRPTSRMRVDELFKWRDEVLIPAIRLADSSDAPLTPGPWCKESWCPGLMKNCCPAILGKMFVIAKVVPGKEAPAVQFKRNYREPISFSGKELDEILEFSELFRSFLSAVESEAENRLRLNSSDKPLTLKLVEGKGSSSWAQEESATVEKLKAFLPKMKMYEPAKMKSVADMKKTLKEAKYDPAKALDGLVTVKKGVVVAPITDKRKEWSPVADMFEVSGVSLDDLFV